jgi:transcriptional regulator with XRE-family HTH domain
VIGKQIKALREQAGLTQKVLAESVGVKRAAVARIESGIRDPSPDLLERLAKRLGCDVRLVPRNGRKKSRK